MIRNASLGQFAVFLCIGSVSSGCGAPVSWLGGGGSARTPHEEVIPLDEKAPPRSSTPDAAPSPRQSVQIVNLAFEVLRIEIPISSIQHSRKIWNHIDELRVNPKLVARQARNGMRLGAVSQDAWPAIRAILDAGNADVRKDQLLAPSGLPLSIGVGTVSDSESIFCYGPNHQLVGNTFSAGNKLIEVNYAVRPEMGGRVDLQVSLEIRHDRGVMTWEKTAGVIQQVPDYDRHVFSDLRATVALNLGESLLIGPGEETRNEYLVGSRFFTGRRDGDRYETLYCITPVPHRHLTAWREED